MALKSCQVYATDETIYVFPLAVTEFGIAITWEPFFKIERASSSIDIGQTVLQALAHSKHGIPHPPPETLPTLEKQMVMFTGRKTWKSFARSARGLSVVLDREVAVLTPYAKGPRDSFVPETDRSIRTPANAENIGKSIASLFQL